MHKLAGYCDRWSAKPGQTVRFMVSSAGDVPFELRFVRHVCTDPNPNGPGYTEFAMPTALDGKHAGREQPAWLGSYGHAPGVIGDVRDGIAISATIWPTTPLKGRQGIVALRAGKWQFVLGIGANGGAMAEATSPDGRSVCTEIATPMLTRRWYDIVAVLDRDGRLRVAQHPRPAYGTIAQGGAADAAGAALPSATVFEVFLAAMPPDGSGVPASAHYNGKLERPTIWRGAAAMGAVLARQRGAKPNAGTPDVIAAWDFSIGIPGMIASDTGPAAAHAQLINLPTRAMTGANWTGAVHDWKVAPEQYGAIHFHDDDQGDLGWSESFSLEIPANWPSGFYAAHVKNAEAEDLIPFFVRPAKPVSDTLFLVPTYTYQVYGCFQREGRGAEIRGRATSWGALTETPDLNPQFGLSAYNLHSDGSGVCITTMRRPMLDTRPRFMILMDPAPNGSGTGRISSDSYIIHWLTRLGFPHDIATDHDLHEEGAELLTPYRVVIAGQHPEYYSERMMTAMEDYLAGGGRLMYLGGNGFYWRCEPSASEPHALEVRRAEDGIRVWATEPGENYHAFGGGYAGLWRRLGRPAHRLVGNGFSVQGKHLGFPYRFADGINHPRVGFMRAGLDVVPGQVFGDSGFMGGGAAGFELDSVDERLGTPPHAIVIAKGVVIHPDYGPVNEDILVLKHPKPQEDWSCADMVFFETSAGGAVFSVGSMTFAGSLPVEDCDSVLGRLTANVLRRFLDPQPFA